ncbi:MAG: dTDP-4-dehydrorhamnose reductase [Alistipes sp.]|nr:dTDP-4-dehydrorhamnose reductase [Alistipes sp.]
MLRIVVTGGGGQLATAIARRAMTSEHSYHFVSSHEVDICDTEALRRALEGVDIVINTAAYTDVEAAEEQASEAHSVNVIGVRNIATLCLQMGIRLIHISTDYVFGGDSERREPYAESDAVAPINVYGRTKAEGEIEALKAPEAIVVRTSWLYAPWGKNFYRTIRRLAESQTEIRVVDDQRGRPTSALSLADMLVTIIELGTYRRMSGTYHFSDCGEATWYDFATEIVRKTSGGRCSVVACRSEERPSKASRPRYSVLATDRIVDECGIELRSWQERLSEVIEYTTNE